MTVNELDPRTSPAILLAEDSPDDAYFFQRAIRRCGIECVVRHASDGGVAVEILREALLGHSKMPDIIFLDLKMPVLTGFEVLEWIQRQNSTRSFQLIVLSGSDQPCDRLRARELGAAHYLVKPITADCLAERLQSLAASFDPSLQANI